MSQNRDEDGGDDWDLILSDETATHAFAAAIGDLVSNSSACSYYRILQFSGTTSDTPFLREIELKVRMG